jgi:type II secretory pathway component GspD/PulD (secretin)
MNRCNLVRLVLAALFTAFSPASNAQQALEIIPLRYRTVEQVLPSLQPLLEPGATLSGSRGQLFLRASPSNADDIKRALAVIDRPAKRLQISVRLDDALEHERRDIQASGSVGSNGVRFSAGAQDARTSAGERVDQRLQVLEGSRAYIATGQSRLLRLPDGTVIQELASGFEVLPRLSGGLVHLDIAQQREAGMHSQRLTTTTTARLGEWVELGGTAQAMSRDDRGIGSAGGRRASESRRVWVKVEALD